MFDIEIFGVFSTFDSYVARRSACSALASLRGTDDVKWELNEMLHEQAASKHEHTVSHVWTSLSIPYGCVQWMFSYVRMLSCIQWMFSSVRMLGLTGAVYDGCLALCTCSV